MPPNQTKTEGNDDRSSWALAAMTAAQHSFPLPASANSSVSWFPSAQSVFDGQIARWDGETCGARLRGQIFTFNNGYHYNDSYSNGYHHNDSFSNGDFVQLAARLARYTSNTTYND